MTVTVSIAAVAAVLVAFTVGWLAGRYLLLRPVDGFTRARLLGFVSGYELAEKEAGQRRREVERALERATEAKQPGPRLVKDGDTA